MDQKLSDEIQASINAVNEQLSEMSDLSSLNERLNSANEGLADGADALKAAAEELPPTLAGFRSLSERLGELAKVLEGSELAVLVTQVNKIEADLEPLQKFADQSADSVRSIVNSQLSSSEEEMKAELDHFRNFITAKLDSVADELRDTNEAISKVAETFQKESAQIKALVGAAAAITILLVIAI